MAKEFSVTKWVLFPPATAGLAAGIAYFNIKTFGLSDSTIYIVALGLATIFSLALVKYSGSPKKPVRIAAYAFEGLMLATMVFNAAYSLRTQRDLAIARQSEANQLKGAEFSTEAAKADAAKWEAIKQMGPKARAAAARAEEAKAKVSAPGEAPKTAEAVNLRSVFGDYEAVLTWAAILEMIFSVGGTFATYGIATLKAGIRRVPRGGFRGQRPVVGVSIPRPPVRRAPGFVTAENSREVQGSREEARGSFQEASRKQGEETSQNFCVKGQDSGVQVKMGNYYVGHIAWPVYLGAVADPQQPTEDEIRSLLGGRL